MKTIDGKLPAPTYQKWQPEDKARLEERKSLKIDTNVTALGRHGEPRRRQLFASVVIVSPEEWDEMKAESAAHEWPAPTETGEEGGQWYAAGGLM